MSKLNLYTDLYHFIVAESVSEAQSIQIANGQDPKYCVADVYWLCIDDNHELALTSAGESDLKVKATVGSWIKTRGKGILARNGVLLK